MRLRSTTIFCLAFLLLYQTSQESIRQHYESAEAQRRAGNLAAAELEYVAILGEAYERLGEIYSAQENYEGAIPVLKSAVGYRPNSQVILMALAIAYFNEGQYDRVVECTQKVLSMDPQNSGAHQMSGKAFFMLGDLDKAIEELETTLKLSPEDIELKYTLGIAYLRNRQADAAKQLYSAMIKQHGDLPQLHIVIGRAYRQSGLLAEAAEEFKKAIALDSHFPRSHYYLGITYLQDEGQNKLPEALEEFKQELAANPDEFLANYYIGVVYIFQRKWEPALPFLLHASSIEPENPDPYFQLGQAYQELNQHERAVEVLRKSIAYNPDLAHNKNQVTAAHHRLGQSLLKLGQTIEGQKELQIASDLKAEAFKLEQLQTKGTAIGNGLLSAQDTGADLGVRPKGQRRVDGLDEKKINDLRNSASYFEKIIATAHNNVGLLRAERQDFVVAAAQFALAVKWNPQQEGLDYNLGLAYYKSGVFDRAIAPLENELSLHPENVPARVLLGMSYFMTEKYSQASDLLGAVVKSSSVDVNTYYALASSLIKQNKTDNVDALIAQMKSATGETGFLHLLVAEKFLSKGDRAGALNELLETAKLNTNSPGIHYFAGLLYLKSGRMVEAIREFDEEIAVSPNDINTKFRLASVLLANKKIDRGILILRDIIKLFPEFADAHYKLGQALRLKSDAAGAIASLETAIRLSPENAEYHFELGQAYLEAGRKVEGRSQIDISIQLKSKVQKIKSP